MTAGGGLPNVPSEAADPEAFIGIEKPRPGEGKGLGQKHTLWDKAQF